MLFDKFTKAYFHRLTIALVKSLPIEKEKLK